MVCFSLIRGLSFLRQQGTNSISLRIPWGVPLGEHIDLNSQAAIKVLDTKLTSVNVERFHEEARTITRLEHPHIVRTLDFGVENGIPFLVITLSTIPDCHPEP